MADMVTLSASLKPEGCGPTLARVVADERIAFWFRAAAARAAGKQKYAPAVDVIRSLLPQWTHLLPLTQIVEALKDLRDAGSLATLRGMQSRLREVVSEEAFAEHEDALRSALGEIVPSTSGPEPFLDFRPRDAKREVSKLAKALDAAVTLLAKAAS